MTEVTSGAVGVSGGPLLPPGTDTQGALGAGVCPPVSVPDEPAEELFEEPAEPDEPDEAADDDDEDKPRIKPLAAREKIFNLSDSDRELISAQVRKTLFSRRPSIAFASPKVAQAFAAEVLTDVVKNARKGQKPVLSLNEAGNAERFALVFGPLFRYVDDTCYVWDGARWSKKGKKRDERLALALTKAMTQEGWAVEPERLRAGTLDWAAQSQTAARVRTMLELVRAEHTVEFDDFDRAGNTARRMVFRQGMYDFRTRQLVPNDPSLLNTKLAATDFDPTATCPSTRKFLSDAMLGDPEMIAFIRRYIGSTLMGDDQQQWVGIWRGTGGNGKGVVQRLLAHVLGSDHVGKVNNKALRAKQNESDHEASLLPFRGRRVMFADEAEGRFNVGLVQEYSGGGTVTMRPIASNDAEEVPITWVLTIMCNNIPDFGSIFGRSVDRRFLIIPWQLEANKEDDPDLEERLKKEAKGVVNLLIECAIEFLEEGLKPPARVLLATKSVLAEANHVSLFLDDAYYRFPIPKGPDGNFRLTEGDEPMSTPAGQVFDDYEKWCDAHGHSKGSRLGRVQFATKMDDMGHPQKLNKKGEPAQDANGKIRRLGLAQRADRIARAEAERRVEAATKAALEAEAAPDPAAVMNQAMADTFANEGPF